MPYGFDVAMTVLWVVLIFAALTCAGAITGSGPLRRPDRYRVAVLLCIAVVALVVVVFIHA